MGVPEHLGRRPLSAHLQAWGRADTGWWACVTWFQAVLAGDTAGELPIAAWVPAAIVRPTGYGGDTAAIPRVTLGADPRSWPMPNGSPAWNAGRWLDGDLPLPPGLVVDEEPAWRRRRRI